MFLLIYKDSAYGSLTGTIQGPLLWTAETPHLYILVVSLYSSLSAAEEGNGTGEGRQPIDVETCRVGIRDIQFSGMVNGYTGRRELTLLGRGREVWRGKEEKERVRGRGEE